MKYFLRIRQEVFEIEGAKFKEDDRLFYVNLRKNDLSVNEGNYQLVNEGDHMLVDIRTGIYVINAKSKKALFEMYQQQKAKYENFLNKNEKYMIELEKELKKLIEGE